MNKKHLVYALTIFIGITAFAIGAARFAGVGVQAGEVIPHAYEFGNHNLQGLYEFHADGVVEVNGVPTRGIWEVGKFYADGNGNLLSGVEYSNLLSSDNESVIDVPFTFEGTYQINPDGTGKTNVAVFIPAAGITIDKTLWFVIHKVDESGIAQGFAGGHADADLGAGAHGNSRTHIGTRIGPYRRK